MSAQLDALIAKVELIKTRVDSLIALTNGLAQMIRDLRDDPAALEDLANQLDAKAADIQSAIDANTTP